MPSHPAQALRARSRPTRPALARAPTVGAIRAMAVPASSSAITDAGPWAVRRGPPGEDVDGVREQRRQHHPGEDGRHGAGKRAGAAHPHEPCREADRPASQPGYGRDVGRTREQRSTWRRRGSASRAAPRRRRVAPGGGSAAGSPRGSQASSAWPGPARRSGSRPPSPRRPGATPSVPSSAPTRPRGRGWRRSRARAPSTSTVRAVQAVLRQRALGARRSASSALTRRSRAAPAGRRRAPRSARRGGSPAGPPARARTRRRAPPRRSAARSPATAPSSAGCTSSRATSPWWRTRKSRKPRARSASSARSTCFSRCRGDGDAVREPRGQAGRGRLVPGGEPQLARPGADLGLGEPRLQQRRAHGVLRGGHGAGAVVAHVVGVGAVEHGAQAALARHRRAGATTARSCRSSSGCWGWRRSAGPPSPASPPPARGCRSPRPPRARCPPSSSPRCRSCR